MKLESLSVLIPAYNTQSTVAPVVKEVYALTRTLTPDLEVIVIDDASSDRTPEILKNLSKTIPVLNIITHPKNRGYGVTIKELYRTGSKEWLFSLPSDNQFDARELLKLLPATGRADMILGTRIKRHDSLRRLIQSKTYNLMLNILFGISLTDVNTIRLMKRSVVHSVPLVSDSAFVDAELAIRAGRKGFRIAEIPVTHKKRREDGATGGKIVKTILPTVGDMLRMLAIG